MDDRTQLTQQSQPETWDRTELLRTAAQTLRHVAREVPRGPWRWGDPDLGVGESTPIGIGEPTPIADEPRPGQGPHLPRWRVHAEPDDGIYPGPARKIRTDAIGPELAEALAALLDSLAERNEDSGASPSDEVERAAVAVAACVIHTVAELPK